MEKTVGRILKSDDVKLEGQFHLDVAQVNSAKGGIRQAGSALAVPQARVVENYPEYAVIEITCTCGAGMYLRCEYAGAQTPADSQA